VKTHLNTLFVTLEGAYLKKDGEAVAVKLKGETKIRVPLHNLDGIVSFGWDNTASASLMAACHNHGVALSFLSPFGKFLASSYGGVSGNILLRREQYRRAEHEPAALEIARNMIQGKLHNARTVLQRAARDHGLKDADRASQLQTAVDSLATRIQAAGRATSLDSLRGIEGDAAVSYWAVFNQMLTAEDSGFQIKGRTKRPPLDRTNALLSFLYAMLAHDCRSACESCGLDPQSGFLHQPRPGRASLALDLMEEFRPVPADRLALSLINRQQITAKDFQIQESGAVSLREDPRKIVLQAWQEKKQDEINHPLLNERMTLGLLPHIQARLLARHLRGDLDAYPAFLNK
jgi:CRISPR-associated protein Cas1